MGELLIFSGDDEFVRKQRAHDAIAALTAGVADAADVLEIVPGDGDDAKFESVAGKFLEALRTLPFFAPTKVVWLRHLADFAPFGDAKLSETAATLLGVISSPLPTEVAAVIDGPGLDQRKSYVKGLKSAGAKIQISTVSHGTDKGFADRRKQDIAEFIASTGKKLAPDAMRFLIEAVGGDSGTLANELEKLRCYVGDASEITLADCGAVISLTPETVSWQYTAAIMERNVGEALHLLAILLDPGDSEMRVLAALSGEYQKMIQTKLAMRELNVERVNPRTFDSLADAKERYPDNPLLKLHPYRAFKVCQNAAAFKDADLAKKLTLVRNAARDLVSGRGERRLILEELTIALAS